MAKLSPRTNKKAEARQIASDLLKENEYVYNPRENTYQLVNKETGAVYTGPLGGLDADKGLLQSDRKLKRLIGEQLSHQRHLVSREPVKTSTTTKGKDGSQGSGTVDGVVKDASTVTTDKEKDIDKGEELATAEDLMDFRILKDESFGKLSTPLIDKYAGAKKSASELKPKVDLATTVEGNIDYNNLRSHLDKYYDLTGVTKEEREKIYQQPTRDLPEEVILASMKDKHELKRKAAQEELYNKLRKEQTGFPRPNKIGRDLETAMEQWDLENPLPSEDLVSGLGTVTIGSPEMTKLNVGATSRKNGGRLKEKKCGGTMKHEAGGKAIPKYQNDGKFYWPSTLNNTGTPDNLVDYTKNKHKEPVVREESPQKLKSTFETDTPITAETAKLAPIKKVTTPEKDPSLWDKVKSYWHQGGSGTQDADTRSLLEKSMDYANPALTLTDYFVQRNALNDIKDQKSVRTYDTATRYNVRAASDLPYEVLVARQNDINRMRSDYKGSDPVMELVSKQMVGQEQLQARERLNADRATHIAGEQSRVDEMLNKNIAEAGSTNKANLSLKRGYDEADRQQDIDIDNRQASLTGQLIGTTAEGLENRLNTRDAATMKGYEMELKQIGSDIAYYSALVRDTDGSTPDGRNTIAKAQEELFKLQQQQKAILGEVQGEYTQLGEDTMLGMKKNGGKLVPRK